VNVRCSQQRQVQNMTKVYLGLSVSAKGNGEPEKEERDMRKGRERGGVRLTLHSRKSSCSGGKGHAQNEEKVFDRCKIGNTGEDSRNPLSGRTCQVARGGRV